MDILATRLEAIHRTARPQTLIIPTQPGEDFIIGRSNFHTGEDTIISRRHARFNVNSNGPEKLVVTNLSLINGILVNFTPLQPYQEETLYDGDEIVHSRVQQANIVFLGGTWANRTDPGG